MLSDSVRDEKRLLSSHDARREFMELVQAQQIEAYRYYMVGRPDDCLKRLEYLYLNARGLFSYSERSALEDAFAGLRKLLKHTNQRDYYKARIDASLMECVGLLHDTLHAHKLLLPVSFESDDDDDTDTMLSGGGL